MEYVSDALAVLRSALRGTQRTLALVGAEWFVLRVRSLRTRVFVAPSGIVVLTLLIAAQSPAGIDVGGVIAVWAITLGAVAVGYVAGSDEDRLSLGFVMTHPTRPVAVVLGRWSCAVLVAGSAYGLGAVALATTAPRTSDVMTVSFLGFLPLGSASALTLLAAWWGGATVAAVAVVWCLFPGAIERATMVTLLGGGPIAEIGATVVHAAPTLVNVGSALAGDGTALVLCAGWLPLGLGGAWWLLRRRRAWPEVGR